uniref:RRM domain-containing protein n=1 Tax=Anopheles dirus TaxID=7168 RepID=A0A182NF52_9DIPT
MPLYFRTDTDDPKKDMVKRKSVAPATAANGADSDGSDYEVEWQVKPTAPKINKAEHFPLPPQIAKNLNRPARGARKYSTSEEDSDVETAEGLPTLTSSQIAAILETIKNNKRLVLQVKNLNFSTAKEEVQEHFEQAGRVKGVRIPKHRSSGFAFVEMLNAEGFQKAFLLDGSFLDGRKIIVNLSESGNKKSTTRIQLLEKKNAEIRKMRKKNQHVEEAAEITLVPDASVLEKKVPPPCRYLDKPKQRKLTKKEGKELRKKTILRAKFQNLEKKGIKA